MTSRPDPAPAASVSDAGAVRRDAWRGVVRANDLGVELIVAILFWTGIGWLVDGWLGTRPWFLVIGALLGNAAGLYLVWVRSSRMEGVRPEPAPPSSPVDPRVGGPAGAS
jgi:F0F1-type ATP synthase assembly protein I